MNNNEQMLDFSNYSVSKTLKTPNYRYPCRQRSFVFTRTGNHRVHVRLRFTQTRPGLGITFCTCRSLYLWASSESYSCTSIMTSGVMLFISVCVGQFCSCDWATARDRALYWSSSLEPCRNNLTTWSDGHILSELCECIFSWSCATMQGWLAWQLHCTRVTSCVFYSCLLINNDRVLGARKKLKQSLDFQYFQTNDALMVKQIW